MKQRVNGAGGLEEPSAVLECHGSETEFRNQKTCIAERCVFHGMFLSGEAEVSMTGSIGRWHGVLVLRKGKRCEFGWRRLAPSVESDRQASSSVRRRASSAFEARHGRSSFID